MGRYSFDDLLKKVQKNPSQKNIGSLVDWLSKYDIESWNGDVWDCDGLVIRPIYSETENEFGDYEILKYVLES